MLWVAIKPIMLSVIMQNVIDAKCHNLAHYAGCNYVEYHYAECHNAECHYAECYNAECHFDECHYAECTN